MHCLAFFSSSSFIWFHPISADHTLFPQKLVTATPLSSFIRQEEPQACQPANRISRIITRVNTKPTPGQGQVRLALPIRWELVRFNTISRMTLRPAV